MYPIFKVVYVLVFNGRQPYNNSSSLLQAQLNSLLQVNSVQSSLAQLVAANNATRLHRTSFVPQYPHKMFRSHEN